MAVEAQLSEDGKTLTLLVPARLDITAHKEFAGAYKDKIDSISRCVVDLTAAEFLDSSALGMLLMLRERANAANVTITISNCNSAISKVLEMANFHKLFEIC